MEPILKDSVGRSHRLAVGSNEAPQRSDLVKNDNDLEWLPELANLRESDVLATIYVHPGSIWLQPQNFPCRLLPPELNNLSDLERKWIYRAVSLEVGSKCRILLRPGDRFDIGEGSVSFTVELRPQDRIEVTSSLPEAPSPSRLGHDREREDHDGYLLLNRERDGKEIPQNSVHVPQSFIASGQPRSPSAPPYNTLETVEETPHLASRYYTASACIPPESEGQPSPSKKIAGLGSSAHLSPDRGRDGSTETFLNGSYISENVDGTDHSNEQIRPPGYRRDGSGTVVHPNSPLEKNTEVRDNMVLDEDENSAEKPQDLRERCEDVDSTGPIEKIENTSGGSQNSPKRMDHGDVSLPENKTGDMHPSPSDNVPEIAGTRAIAIATPKRPPGRPRKREHALSDDSLPARSTKRSKVVLDESQDSVDSTIDVVAHSRLAIQRSNLKKSPDRVSVDENSEAINTDGKSGVTIRERTLAAAGALKTPRTGSKRKRRGSSERSLHSSPKFHTDDSPSKSGEVQPSKEIERKVDASTEDEELEAEKASDKSPIPSVSTKVRSRQAGDSRDEPRQTSSTASTPASSNRSRRSDDPSVAPSYQGKPMKVVFSSNSKFGDHSGFKQFLRRQGSSTGQHVTDKSDVLCIGNGEIRKSSSLLLAVAYGKQIVTDTWATKSLKAGYLLEPTAFLPSDPTQEQEWKFRMSDISGQPRDELFFGRTIYLTPTLKKEYGASGCKEIEEIARACGAASVISKAAKDVPDNLTAIILGSTSKDNDVSLLQKDDHSCFHKDLLSMSVLRGSLELQSDEFRLRQGGTDQRKTPKRKAR